MPEATLQRAAARRRLALALEVESPFPWQLALLDRFLNGEATSAIDVPTGLGKTAVMAIWLVARAAGAALPRRLVYVVDRRAVVDQASQVAVNLRALVERDASFKDALGLEGPLPISTLRGKHLDNREWLANPSLPALVLGTVDMVGSRLLFGGYGISQKMRPYHAGLLGADSLIVLDEAHLVPPFERLIEALSSGIDAKGCSLRAEEELQGLVPPVRFLSLSATGRGRRDALRLSDEDRAHPTVARRLTAIKRVIVHGEVGARDLPERLAEEAWTLSAEGALPIRCIIFCNGRDDAAKVRAALDSRCKKSDVVSIDTELFVGGRRLFEREAAAHWLKQRGFLAGASGRPERATFVIATSAGEVGVDLDADHMVSDLVAWERMVQRLGRVNRRGEGRATVMVVPALAEDEKIQARLTATRLVLEQLPRLDGEARDGSPGALTDLKARAERDAALTELIESASTPEVLHPPLPRATIEAWSMTSLEEHPGRPEVGPWIRGWIEEEDPQTTIVWRKHLPVNDRGALFGPTELEAFRDSADPHLAERLDAETFRVIEWLDKRLKTLKVSEEDDHLLARHDRPLRKEDTVAVVLDGPAASRTLTAADLSNKEKRDAVKRALGNALLIVDVRVGGLEGGLLAAESNEALDVTQMEGEQRVVPFRTRRISLKASDAEEASTREWRKETRIPVERTEEGETEWLLIESLVSEAAESEEGRSVAAKRMQTLEEHETWAEAAAGRIATRLALPDAYAETLRIAARRHDEGKRATRWQQAFKAPPGDVYAKTTSRPNLQLLERYRHELGSLPYAERDERVQRLSPALQELCLHLIAAHHGFARPVMRTDGAEEPPTRLALRAQEIALRFARLEKRWGPWGLAWWEALLRAADQQASRDNDLEGGARG